MYELYRYILPFRKTNFNPFRLAAAIASCSPPSPASGDGFHKASALSARHFFLSTCAHTPRIAEFEAKPRDFRMERHVLGSGRSVSGRRRGSPRRLRNVVLADGNRPTSDGKRLLRTATARSAAVLTARKAALFACGRSAREASDSGAQGKSYAPSPLAS